MWLAILIVCGNMHAQSCIVITGNDLHTSKEKCFEKAIESANTAITYPHVFQARPFCQIIPNTESRQEI